MMRLLVGFLPWIVFGVLARRWFLVALGLAIIISAVTTAQQCLKRSPKILDTATLAFFIFIAIGLIGFQWMVLGTYMSVLVNGMLAAIAWVSLFAGVPFTIQYAREQVAEEFWHTPLFLRINQYITAVWGLDFLLSALVALYRVQTGARGLAAGYAWILFTVIAVVFTLHFPDWYKSRALRPAASNPESGNNPIA